MVILTIFRVIHGAVQLQSISLQRVQNHHVFMDLMSRMAESATIVHGEEGNLIRFMWEHAELQSMDHLREDYIEQVEEGCNYYLYIVIKSTLS